MHDLDRSVLRFKRLHSDLICVLESKRSLTVFHQEVDVESALMNPIKVKSFLIDREGPFVFRFQRVNFVDQKSGFSIEVAKK